MKAMRAQSKWVTGTAGLVAVLAAAVTLWGCPNQGLVCGAGLSACGEKTCEDLQNDKHNCGACGVSCQVGQICREGACICGPGATDCNGQCVTLLSDARNCGACGTICAANEVCADGDCVTGCEAVAGSTQCGLSCVHTDSDPNNCGGCGAVCDQGQSCRDGSCHWDLVLACFTNGQVRGMSVQNGTALKGPAVQLGTAPQALASFGSEVLLSVDGSDQKLHQARLSTLASFGPANDLGQFPNQALVSGDHVFVINSGGNSLASFKALPGAQDAGLQFPDGVTLTLSKELPFGDNAFPQVMVQVGNTLFVTLYGGFDAVTAAAGQKVVEVDITNPDDPTLGATHELSGLPLAAFPDSGTPIPRPQGITERNGTLYVALNNLNSAYGIAGPGYLATLPLDGGTPGLVELPTDKCLNPVWARTQGDNVLVSCVGRATYDEQFNVTAVEASGLALVGTGDQVLSAVSVACPGEADGGCLPPSLGRFEVMENVAWVGDQTAGRLYPFEIDLDGGSALLPRSPIDVCAPNPNGFSNLADVLVVP